MDEAAQEEVWERIRRQDEHIARRKIAYDRVRQLGRERAELDEATARNMNSILQAIRDARGDLTIEEAATAIGVSRQTVHRWLRIGDGFAAREDTNTSVA